MNVKLRQLQDEAAKVVSEIESLRAIEAADENEATTIEENLAAACQRSDELIAEIERTAVLPALDVLAIVSFLGKINGCERLVVWFSFLLRFV